MRMLDTDGDRSVHQLQLYLTPREAQELRMALDRLLADPEANEHEHVFAEEAGRELSLSIITPAKLRDPKGHTKVEQRLFNER
jgi:hypothetical protein